MLLCSSNEDHSKVEPLCPPAGVPLGELVTFEGHLPSPVDAGNRAGKAWKKASKTLVVDDSKVNLLSCVYYCCMYGMIFGRGGVNGVSGVRGWCGGGMARKHTRPCVRVRRLGLGCLAFASRHVRRHRAEHA